MSPTDLLPLAGLAIDDYLSLVATSDSGGDAAGGETPWRGALRLLLDQMIVQDTLSC